MILYPLQVQLDEALSELEANDFGDLVSKWSVRQSIIV